MNDRKKGYVSIKDWITQVMDIEIEFAWVTTVDIKKRLGDDRGHERWQK